MSALRLVALAVIAFAAGSGLAALAEGDFDPCFMRSLDLRPAPGVEGVAAEDRRQLWPPGKICTFTGAADAPAELRVAPSVPGTLATVALTAALLAWRRRRPSTFADGAVIAAGLLGLAGWAPPEVTGVALVVLIVGTPLAFAATLALGRHRGAAFAVLGTVAVVAGALGGWGIVTLAGLPLVPVPVGVAAAGALNALAAAAAPIR